jgi:hypothetical protein
MPVARLRTARGWHALIPAAGVQRHDGRSPDFSVYGERQQVSGEGGLAVRRDQLVGVLAGHDHGGAESQPRG